MNPKNIVIITQELFERGWVNKLLKQTEKRAKKNNLNYDLTRNFLIQLFEKQEGKCALTLMHFKILPEKTTETEKRRPFIPSIDRISSNKGYTKENVRLVCLAVNMALFTWGDSVFDEVVTSRIEVLKGTKINKISNDLILTNNEEYSKQQIKKNKEDLVNELCQEFIIRKFNSLKELDQNTPDQDIIKKYNSLKDECIDLIPRQFIIEEYQFIRKFFIEYFINYGENSTTYNLVKELSDKTIDDLIFRHIYLFSHKNKSTHNSLNIPSEQIYFGTESQLEEDTNLPIDWFKMRIEFKQQVPPEFCISPKSKVKLYLYSDAQTWIYKNEVSDWCPTGYKIFRKKFGGGWRKYFERVHEISIQKPLVIEEKPYSIQMFDRQIKSGEKHIIMGVGALEYYLDLPVGWFCKRRQFNQPVPKEISKAGTLTRPKYKYDYNDVIDWFNKNNIDTNWCPPGFKVVQSIYYSPGSYGKKRFQKIQDNNNTSDLINLEKFIE